jgi:hypothetical protein
VGEFLWGGRATGSYHDPYHPHSFNSLFIDHLAAACYVTSTTESVIKLSINDDDDEEEEKMY